MNGTSMTMFNSLSDRRKVLVLSGMLECYHHILPDVEMVTVRARFDRLVHIQHTLTLRSMYFDQMHLHIRN